MANVEKLSLVALTRSTSNAGSGDVLNVTIDIDGNDVVDENFWQERETGQGSFDEAEHTINNLETTHLTNSSIRLGTRGDDAWRPQHVVLLGRNAFVHFPFAMVTDSQVTLSTDTDEGHLSMPLLPLSINSTLSIQRLLLLVHTNTAPAFHGLTNDNIFVQIANLVHGEHILFEEQIPRGPQRYLRRNWYFFDVLTPFTRGDVNRVTLRTDGEDFWLPWYFFLFGLDTAAGNPTQAYPLVDIPPHKWDMGGLSTNHTEGRSLVSLPLSSTLV